MKDFIITDEILKLICVDKPNERFTIGKVYESKQTMKHIELDAFVVLVCNDVGVESWQGGSCFKSLDELRNDKINNIINGK